MLGGSVIVTMTVNSVSATPFLSHDDTEKKAECNI